MGSLTPKPITKQKNRKFISKGEKLNCDRDAKEVSLVK
jgi:hypothetical protein